MSRIEKQLCVNGQPIRSNDKNWCARCLQPIVDANRSEWEVFTKDGATQPICIFCQDAEKNVTTKVS